MNKVTDTRRIRQKLGMTLQQFSNELGVTIQTVYRWEHDISKPSPLALEKLRDIEQRGKE